MKHFIWLLCGIFLFGLLLGTLSACGANDFTPAAVVTTEKPASGPETDPAPEEPSEPEGQPGPEDASRPGGEDEARRAAYGKVLRDALFSGVLPNGESLDWLSAEDSVGNEFAVCDLNGDGEEELLLHWTDACMAGTADFVFRYDQGAVSQEFLEFAGVEFYTSGAAIAPWSHNQGWAGRFWPFNLYQYDPETKTYVELAAVDAWDLTCVEGDETLTAAFPRDVDIDGDGLVYYILTGDWYKESRVPSDGNLFGQLWGTDPVDGPDYENWLNASIGGGELIQLPLQKLTEENIAALAGDPAAESAG